MIALVSSSARERAALAALCESRGWVTVECDSVRSATRFLQHSPARIVVMRQTLHDGFSDQILADLAVSGRSLATRSVVIVSAGTPSALEARQIDLGADCVLRDPIRLEALLAYLAKYQREPEPTRASARPATASGIAFAGGILQPSERTLQHDGRTAPLTPREIELVELLVRSAGEIVTYETLYSEILHRPFRGETSNMRVLLGKLVTSAGSIGLAVRTWVEVVPKTGYRYRATRRMAAGATACRRRLPARV